MLSIQTNLLSVLKLSTGRLFLHPHGKSSAVLIDVEDYQKLLDKVQLLQEISTARKELDEGKGIDNDEFIAELRSQFSDS